MFSVPVWSHNKLIFKKLFYQQILNHVDVDAQLAPPGEYDRSIYVATAMWSVTTITCFLLPT